MGRMVWMVISIALLWWLAPVEGMRLELVHRHHGRFSSSSAVLDQAAAVRGFVLRDRLRRQRMNQRWGVGGHQDSHHRRSAAEVQIPMQSGRDYTLGEYFVEVEVGTPGQSFWLVADTGSEFTWFNCLMRNVTTRSHKKKRVAHHHHHHHHHQHHHHHHHHHHHKARNKTGTRQHQHHPHQHGYNPCDGVFCAHKSRSFETITCSSRKCKVDLSELFSLASCPKPSDPCLYDISYADGSSAKGFFGTETLRVDLNNRKEGALTNITIGCTKSMQNGVNFNQDTGGILGLGYAKDSFIDKAGRQYGSKFSYCLVDHLSHRDITSYLTLGGHHPAKLTGEIQRTDLILFPPFYGVHVVGISVGGQMLKIPHLVWDFTAQGGTILDSGTTLTGLRLPAYEPVFEALTKPLTKVKKIPGDDFGALDFCFEAEGFDESEVPKLVFHFTGGAKFEPPVKSYIIDVAPQSKCLGIMPITGNSGASVIGNIMQQNHLWQFDLTQNTVSFARSNCN